MSFKTTMRLFVTVCVLGIVIWFFERHSDSTDIAREKSERVLEMASENINHISIQRGRLRIDCLRKNKGWFIQRPMFAPVEEARIDRMLATIEGLKSFEVVTASQRTKRELTLNDYGLANPRARIQVNDIRKGRHEIFVGDNTPLGSQIYVKVDASDDVIATSLDIWNMLPEKVDEIRDRIVMRGSAAQAVRLEIHKKASGFIQLAQKGGKWTIQQPVFARADNGRIGQMLDKLFSARIHEFVWDPVVNEDRAGGENLLPDKTAVTAKLQEHGLTGDDVALRVTVWASGDEVGNEIIFGKQTAGTNAEVNVKLRDSDSVFTVGRDLMDAFSISLNDLRDRVLFSIGAPNVSYVCIREGDRRLVLSKRVEYGWVMTEPLPSKADDQVVKDFVERMAGMRAESFVEGPQTNNLASQALASPFCTIQLAEIEPPTASAKTPDLAADTQKAVANILAISQPADDSDFVYARMSGSDVIVKIVAEQVRAVLRKPTDALQYRDRKMMSVLPDSIKRISVLKNATEQVVERNPKGGWIAVAPATNAVNNEAIEGFLLQAANLRAVRIETDSPKNLATYGLDGASGVVVTFGLTGTEGIQKTLITGFKSRTDGFFATIQGQDVVFVLDNAVMGMLARDITSPQRREEPDGQRPTKPGGPK